MNPFLSGPEPLYPNSPIGRNLVRDIAIVPRRISYNIREEIVSIMVLELMEGIHCTIRDSHKFRERYGIFYQILIHLRYSPLWYEIQDLAGDSQETATPAARFFITKILDLLDRAYVPGTELYADIDEEIQAFLVALEHSGDETVQDKPDTMTTDLSSLLHELTELLSRLTTDDLGYPPVLNEFCRDCMTAIEHCKDGEEQKEHQSAPESNTLENLLDEFEQAVHDLEKKADPEKDDSGGTKTSVPQNGPGGHGEGTIRADNLSRIASLIHKILDHFQGQNMQLTELHGIQPEFWKSGEESRRLQSILQKTVIDPTSSLIQSLDPHRRAIRFLAEVQPGTDWGLDMTSEKIAVIEKLELFARYAEKNQELKRIIRQIGRMRYDIGVLSHGISPMSRSEMYSITRSRDIARLLPIEMVKISHPKLKLKFFADFSEGKLLTYNLKGPGQAGGRPKKKMGPVVALVDTSGSMNGFPETIAKSIIFALATRMVREKRDVKVILFSGPGDTGEIELSPERKMTDEFLLFLQRSFGGGTDFMTALYSGLESLHQPAFRGADLLFLTDGVSEISGRGVITEWKRVKKEQDARIFSFIIGGDDVGGLSSISDYVYFIEEDPERMLRIIPSPDNPAL